MRRCWVQANRTALPAVVAAIVVLLGLAGAAPAADPPPDLFKDLDDEILGQALILRGKQLFIDDYVIEELRGARKALHRPVKHAANPLIVRDRPWEGFSFSYGTVVHDPQEGRYRLWYQVWQGDPKKPIGALAYATSQDGIVWHKPIVNGADQNNIVLAPTPPATQVAGPSLLLDTTEQDPARRYKMLYSTNPDGTARSWSTGAAYSPDGLDWTPEPQNPLIPFSDTQNCPFWDARLGRYVAYLRFGPPNTRIISRVESEDFVHWSPKVTVLRSAPIDRPFQTQLYNMCVLPYDGVYLGLVTAYHGETIQPIPADQLWMDRKDQQLAFSRNGVTWMRVGPQGAIRAGERHSDSEWREIASAAAFLPHGELDQDWDAGVIHAVQPPLVIGDEIWIYYYAHNARNWWDYHGDAMRDGYGLATLRLDGFVSVGAEEEGALTTRPLVFIGDTLEVNADAAGGSLRVEALDPSGAAIEGFSRADCVPITTDRVDHVLRWTGQEDAHRLQARPIRLRFHLERARLYSFTFRIRHRHYVPSYD